jgi:hypothetical protein
MNSTAINESKLEALQGKVMADIGGAMGVLMAYLGDQAGVYEVLEGAGQSTCEELSEKSGLDARYLREWLSANAVFGYVDYDAGKDTFSLSPEQAAIFAHDGEVTCLQGFFEAIVGQYGTFETAVETFKSGEGRPWSEHLPCSFCATDRFFRPGYIANLVESWIPALSGIDEKLKVGGKVADIGCGHGSSTLLLAQSYPDSKVYGFDFHPPSIEEAKAKAKEAGVKNVEFQVVSAKEFPGKDYDLVCIFDALHDMGDPVGAAAHIQKSLSPDGSFMLVEPLAGDSLEENMNLLSGIFYGFSTTICVPTSKAQYLLS